MLSQTTEMKVTKKNTTHQRAIVPPALDYVHEAQRQMCQSWGTVIQLQLPVETVLSMSSGQKKPRSAPWPPHS